MAGLRAGSAAQLSAVSQRVCLSWSLRCSVQHGGGGGGGGGRSAATVQAAAAAAAAVAAQAGSAAPLERPHACGEQSEAEQLCWSSPGAEWAAECQLLPRSWTCAELLVEPEVLRRAACRQARNPSDVVRTASGSRMAQRRRSAGPLLADLVPRATAMRQELWRQRQPQSGGLMGGLRRDGGLRREPHAHAATDSGLS